MTQMKFLALGDSYTIGEAVAQDERWPVQLVEALRKRQIYFADPEIIATTGWRTDELSQAISERRAAPDYDMVSLLIGVNNLYQGRSLDEYAKEFEALLISAIKLAKSNRRNVFVLSIPDYGYTPFGKDKQEEISRATDSFNEVNRRLTLSHGVSYFDITGVSRDGLKKPELIASDNLHPSGLMYSEWVRIILASDSTPFSSFL